MKCFLGFDGGGTKTECVLLNEDGDVLARGKGPASNPTRIGFPAALAAINETYESATTSTRIPFDVVALCAGLAGTGRDENRVRMLQFLKEQFPNAIVDVRMDLELPLYAMPKGPAIVLVVGTGSAAIGRDHAGAVQREGGFGPANSDKGSAYDIGRGAIAACRSKDPSPEAEELSRQILRHLGCPNWSELDAKSAVNADAVFPRVFPVVAAAADAGNVIAQSVLISAAQELAAISHRLATSLHLDQQHLPLGKTGGAIGRSRFFDQAIDLELRRKLPKTLITPLNVEPAELASRIALQLFKNREGTAK